ncbi:hypothetical protein [Agaribacter flavus]|uniref:Two-component system QseEF-associated lipoprotein QseG n=1 Tax=Agaribacter flavus TaxID=1902781 RepID=A0ABV7FMU6_9ALTE
MKISLFVLTSVFFLSACQLLSREEAPVPPTITEVPVSTWFCTTRQSFELIGEFCELNHWAKVYVSADEHNWSERAKIISNLGDSPQELLHKVLLSQGIDTPYQNRLRAQNWITSLLTVVEPPMAEVLDVMIFQPSQQLLEMESAITLLSQLNASKEKALNELELKLANRKAELETKRVQVEQLLKIEANMADQNRSQ